MAHVLRDAQVIVVTKFLIESDSRWLERLRVPRSVSDDGWRV